MTPTYMRKLAPKATSALSAFRWKSFVQDATPSLAAILGPIASPLTLKVPSRALTQIRHVPGSEVWFTPAVPAQSPSDDLLGPGGSSNHRPPDERTLKLGKTLRTLSPLLPDILRTPLPSEILSPSIVLHLFPSTHPHLPSVRGKVAYRATLWTAPVAWGTLPILGNVKLQILSEKIVRAGYATIPGEENQVGEEKLVVRWKTKCHDTASSTASGALSTSTTPHSDHKGGHNGGLSKLLGGDKPIFNLSKDNEFTGLFIFGFDEKGRIASHTIEHADEGNGLDKTSSWVTLTDWLLGKAKLGRHEGEGGVVPGLAMRGIAICKESSSRRGDK